ncbi:MAG: ABC transporter permease subunit [Lachnospiraceae bacterium]|nr:ABC transporter permease subunit [Lachnospiraceae bacterium]
MLIIITIITLVSNLYQTGVNKQLVSNGISRKNIVLGQFFSYTMVLSAVAIVYSVVKGICNMIQGNGFGLNDINIARFALSMIGVILVIASRCALCLLISHFTGSYTSALMLAYVFDLVLPNVLVAVSDFSKLSFLNYFSIGIYQERAVSMTESLMTQVSAMAILFIITVVLIKLCQVVYNRKEIK